MPCVTYSPAFTLVPTYECFNRCDYCNFRVDPGQQAWMSLEQATAQLSSLQQRDVCEILVLSGEVHPQSSRRRDWFQRIYQICERAFSMGFLPHTNAGPLLYEEMAQLKQVNVSMGLMLEQLTPRLRHTVHRQAPSKDPALRLEQLDWAGQLQIPFTTGLLLGIGETDSERVQTLNAIATSHQRWGHIQEVILQPYSPGQQEGWQTLAFSAQKLVEWVTIARQCLPSDVVIQIPPNLVQEPQLLLSCLEAGAQDLGGIVPHDHVNPDYGHQGITQLQALLSPQGWSLKPRLPLYPQFDSWLPEPLVQSVRNWRQRLAVHYGQLQAVDSHEP